MDLLKDFNEFKHRYKLLVQDFFQERLAFDSFGHGLRSRERWDIPIAAPSVAYSEAAVDSGLADLETRKGQHTKVEREPRS